MKCVKGSSASLVFRVHGEEAPCVPFLKEFLLLVNPTKQRRRRSPVPRSEALSEVFTAPFGTRRTTKQAKQRLCFSDPRCCHAGLRETPSRIQLFLVSFPWFSMGMATPSHAPTGNQKQRLLIHRQ